MWTGYFVRFCNVLEHNSSPHPHFTVPLLVASSVWMNFCVDMEKALVQEFLARPPHGRKQEADPVIFVVSPPYFANVKTSLEVLRLFLEVTLPPMKDKSLDSTFLVSIPDCSHYPRSQELGGWAELDFTETSPSLASNDTFITCRTVLRNVYSRKNN